MAKSLVTIAAMVLERERKALSATDHRRRRRGTQPLRDDPVRVYSDIPTVMGQPINFRRNERDCRKPRSVVTALICGDPWPGRPKIGDDVTKYNARIAKYNEENRTAKLRKYFQ